MKHASIAPSLITTGLALVVYSLTLAPDLTWANFGADGGDLITASYTLGIPHPPGYPTYVFLGKLFRSLPLGGTVAYRFNLFSAATMAIAAGFVTVTAEETRNHLQTRSINHHNPSFIIHPSKTIPIATGLTFAFSSLIWSQATISEVYGLNLMFLAAFLWSLWGKRPFWLTGLLLGLSITTHVTSILMLPLALWQIGKQSGWQPRELLTFFAGMLIGLTPFLLIFWLARGNSPIKWGNPTSFAQWVWLVSAQIYQANLFHLPQAQLTQRLLTWGWALLNQFTLLGAPLIIVGLSFPRGNDSQREQKGLLITAVIFIIYATGYNTEDAIIFLLPALLLFTPLLASGLHIAGKYSLFLPLVLLLLNFNSQNLSHETDLRTQAIQLFQFIPENAIILTPGDPTIFTLWYFQHVENQREDLILVDSNLLAFDWYRQLLQDQYPNLVSLEKDDIDAFQQYNAALRPLCTITLVDYESKASFQTRNPQSIFGTADLLKPLQQFDAKESIEMFCHER